MRPWLPTFLALSVATQGVVHGDESAAKKNPASALLPNGSQLQGVVIPRHNKQRVLVNSLIAEVVTLVNDELIAGSNVTIDFFNDLGVRNARIKLREATFNQTIGMLHATETVTIDADTYKARGSGLHFAMRRGQGLLTGPAVTWMHNPPKTAMKPKTPALIGAAGIALVASTGANAEMTGRLTEDGRITQTHGAQAPVKVNTVDSNPITQARSEAQEQLKQAIDSSATSDAEVKTFIDEIPMDYTKLTGSEATKPPSQPLDFTPGPEHTVIDCEGGMYFDSDKGLLIYMKGVKVTDPRYILTGADVLRIYMAKKAEPKAQPGKDQPKPKPSGNEGDKNTPNPVATEQKGPVPAMGGNFDRVEKIVATGAVRILQKAVEKGKEPVEASGALFTYNPDTGDILLSGGYPWVKQGDFYARAKEPNLTLRMKKDGSFVTEGNWEMGGRLNQKNPPKTNQGR